MKSLDAVEWNVAKIAALFPQCVTERLNKEGKPELVVDFDKLRAELSKDVLDTEIAKMKPQYFVMRDAFPVNDNVLDNFEQIFRHYSPDTIRRIL